MNALVGGSQVYMCYICKCIFRTIKVTLDHLKCIHNLSSVKNPHLQCIVSKQCPKSFSTFSGLHRHSKTCLLQFTQCDMSKPHALVDCNINHPETENETESIFIATEVPNVIC